VNSGKARVLRRGPPMSDKVPPAFESGAAEKRPAKNRRVIRAPIEGERDAPIPNNVAKSRVER